jgi:hypothetical protein
MIRAALVVAGLLLSACSQISSLESAAAGRAKQPIIITLYHGHF